MLLLVAGCSQLPSRANKEQHQLQLPDEITREAISLRSAGRWVESLALLKKANSKYPDHAALQEALSQTQILHEHEIHTLEDRMLVVEANALKGKASLLKALDRIDPGNYTVRTRMYLLDRARKNGVKGLVECGKFHKWKNQPLSQHCLRLANELIPSAETQLLLDEVTQSIESEQSRRAQEKQFRKKKRARKKQALQHKERKKEQIKNSKKIEQLLAAAKNQIEEGDYSMVTTTLDKIEAMSPQDSRLHNLRTRLRHNIDKQVEELDKTGDRLYRKEQVQEAVDTWGSALDLDPKREDIVAKVERAMKILNRLKTLQPKTLPLEKREP